MGIRHLARQRALQLLYALEFLDPQEDVVQAERRFMGLDPTYRRGWGPFARDLVRQVFEQQFELDEAFRPALHNWTLERLPLVDRICLRMAMWELRSLPDVPLRVTINEYIDLARSFSTDESPAYINAVLDRLARNFAHKDFGTSEPTGEGEGSGQSAMEHGDQHAGQDADSALHERPAAPAAPAEVGESDEAGEGAGEVSGEGTGGERSGAVSDSVPVDALPRARPRPTQIFKSAPPSKAPPQSAPESSPDDDPDRHA